jgi:GAF domain-containing protein
MDAQGAALVVGPGAAAVPQARRFAADSLAALPADLRDDAELVVSELVTNAVLHTSGPVTVRLLTRDDAVRVEVEDSEPAPPVRVRRSEGAMTGRGLTLVACLSSSWGVQPAGSGKLVWAELRAGAGDEPTDSGDGDLDALLASWSDDDPSSPERFMVRLGAVPTTLLLEAKAHVDNLVRELTLAAASASASLPAHLTELVTSVVTDFAEARSSIKRQAVAAADKGAPETELVLHLPPLAAEAGERYLNGLDEADRYARAARLLTLETPPVHRVFRRWYVQSLVDQLRAQASGAPAPAATTFPQRLAEDYTALSQWRSATESSSSLQALSASLATLMTPEDVAKTVVASGVSFLGASAGAVVVEAHGRMHILATAGYDEELVARLEGVAVDDNLPGVQSHRTGTPLWLESRQPLESHFPALASYEPETQSTCIVPLVAGRQMGFIRFSFAEPHLFDDEERRTVGALADQAALALQRSELFYAEHAARENAERLAARLNLLMKVTAELTGAASPEEIVNVVVRNATEQLGASSARVYLLGDDGMLRSAATSGGDPKIAQQYEEFDVNAELPGGLVLRENEPMFFGNLAELSDRFPALSSVYPTERTLLVAPLRIGDHKIGVLSLTFTGETDVDAATQLAFITTLADATAQALERSAATSRAALASDKLAFLADASVALSETLDFAATLTTVAKLVVPRVADWCTIQVLDGDELKTLAIAHSDPDKVAWAERMQERYPPDPQAATGAPEVIRTGVSELYPEIPDELLVAGAVDDEHLRIIREVGISSALTVPLTGRSGTFGAITMIHAGSGRRYDEEDRRFAEDLARRAALAVETASAFAEQTGRLAAVTRVAEVAQHAILGPPPAQIGPVALSARYVSAAAEALVGGDLYEVISRQGAVRLLIADVRGKGLDAVRKATIVLGEFRAAAADLSDLADVARQIDRRSRPYLDDEDFVTALIAEIRDDGGYTIASCGHPPPLLASGGTVRELTTHATVPLGLGAEPEVLVGTLSNGDRLLLYTDGIMEARDGTGQFVDLLALAQPFADGDLDSVLDRVLEGLRAVTGDELGDDLALLAAEYRGTQA